MSNKYNFTDKYGKDIKDKAPQWMDDFFVKKPEKKENPFKDVDNFLNIGIKKVDKK